MPGGHQTPRGVCREEADWGCLWCRTRKEAKVGAACTDTDWLGQDAWGATGQGDGSKDSQLWRIWRDIFQDAGLWSWGNSNPKKLEIYRREVCKRSLREHIAKWQGQWVSWVCLHGAGAGGGACRAWTSPNNTQTHAMKQTGVGGWLPRQKAPAVRLKEHKLIELPYMIRPSHSWASIWRKSSFEKIHVPQCS